MSTDGTPKVSAHDYVIDRITQEITAATGTNVGARKLARKLLISFTESIFTAAAEEGMYRFGNGFGTLRLKDIKAATRTLPTSGKVVNSPARKKVIYSEGKTVKALVNNT